MFNFPPLESDRNESDVIVDALLSEVAENENGDDLAFLEAMEAAINEADVVPMPSPAEKIYRRILWSSGVAATLILGAGVWFAGIQTNTINQPISAQIVASPPSTDNIEAVLKNTHQNQLSTTPTTINGAGSTIDTIKSSAFSNFSAHSLSDSSVTDVQGMSSNPSLSMVGFGQSLSEDYSHTIDKVTRRPIPQQPGDRSHISIQLHETVTQSQNNALIDNPWASPLAEPLSTFSTDVDTASWTNLRAMIRDGATLESIPNDAVRIEEMINYFDWNYPQPKGGEPFSIQLEAAPCPWNEEHQLLRIGLQGREIPRTDRPAANLVFLLDVSGSMNEPNKLPLLKEAIAILVEELNAEDQVTIVVYAGSEGVALTPTSGGDQKTILNALANLESGGSTNGGAGIKLAYRLAKEQFVSNGINRVILCTDGDFNVGLTGTKELVSLAEKEAESGTYLSVLGFGQGNLNDAMLEEVTNRGNGNYFHIDGIREARKVFLSDLMGTLVTIAKDVKIQVEFNPARVAQYRLIGYANRKLAPEDFANDEIDAGEIGSGHTVTALYEIIPGKAEPEAPELRYQNKGEPAREIKLIPSEELALIKLRYKKPDEDRSILMTETILPPNMIDSLTSRDQQFAAAVALFGMILRNNDDLKDATLNDVLALAERSARRDPHGYRAEFVELVKKLSLN
ncbi:MAG: VWA domain-containing protein [Verrucomicrobiales bacterium]|nr:VWA domain-containing protein [Verrucomicrobiales bacterium]